MTDFNPDNVRLRSVEGDMRRALGLQRESAHALTNGTSGSAPPRRPFARDGDVPVTFVQGKPNGSLVDQLETTRQGLRAQATAREEAERTLVDAQNTIRDLQTKLAHERLAKDEVTQHADAGHQQLEQTLAAVR